MASITRQLADTAAEQDASGSFPHANVALLRQHGLLALAVPQAFGGAGARLGEARAVVAAVARGEPATALILVMQLMLTRSLSQPGHRWPAALRERVLRSAVTDGALGNQLRVEPELGSPARGGLPATVARRTPDGWRLSGHKLDTTGIDGLRWLVVWGRSDEPAPRVGQFLVPADAPGLRIQRSWDHPGMRATASDEVLLDEVRIPADHAVDLRPSAAWAVRPDPGQQAWMTVLLGTLYDAVTRNAIAVVELALRQSGNRGLSRHHPLQRHHRDLLCGRVHTPQDDSALVAAGRAALPQLPGGSGP